MFSDKKKLMIRPIRKWVNFMGKFTNETRAETVGIKKKTTNRNTMVSTDAGVWSPKNEGLLSAGDSGTTDAEFGFSCPADVEFGFSCPDFSQSPLSGTVQFYERHVFLCYKHPQVWPPTIEAAEFDRLPRLLSANLLTGKGEMIKSTFKTLQTLRSCPLDSKPKG